jgi:hypothetical protein
VDVRITSERRIPKRRNGRAPSRTPFLCHSPSLLVNPQDPYLSRRCAVYPDVVVVRVSPPSQTPAQGLLRPATGISTYRFSIRSREAREPSRRRVRASGRRARLLNVGCVALKPEIDFGKPGGRTVAGNPSRPSPPLPAPAAPRRER